ncbi:hypothetical protein EKK97_17835 [Billgrantia tianxiuensis]|uniref:Uncharacterized protein n=2 Tax=Oceanospirillales TaxID=135619 RepID=A0A6I6STR1_9GAMM|nr:hypothetical protein [Halomonas sp. MCCC 1A11057]QHC52194.1 hypothetical protein EKK97_17835 [Halomonas tianxiuensis]
MTDPSLDHADLTDPLASRRYFRKFEQILKHLTRAAAAMHLEGQLDKHAVKVLTGYLVQLNFSFQALSMKYLFSGQHSGRLSSHLTVDRHNSGFPLAAELLHMANDALQAHKHLAHLPNATQLKEQMVRTILSERRTPTRLQQALSQRLYYEELAKGQLFWAQNHPQCEWRGDAGQGRRRFMLHWAAYDSQVNLPVIYLAEVEDSGKIALLQDLARWPDVQEHLMAQSLAGLKLLTIARGFDEDFNCLHPKRLLRFHVGPMYSSTYTRQAGSLRRMLEAAGGTEGQDWVLAWTMEVLESEDVREQRVGWFSKAEREVFALDPFGGQAADTGATRTERAIILPQRPFQALAELDPPGFAEVRKFVVSPSGQVLQY